MRRLGTVAGMLPAISAAVCALGIVFLGTSAVRAAALVPLQVHASHSWPLTEGTSTGLKTLATFRDPNDPVTCELNASGVLVCTAGQPASDYTATVDWGDGTAPQAIVVTGRTVTAITQDPYLVEGSHTYGYFAEGPHTITINITDSVVTTTVESGSGTDTVTVNSDPELIVQGAGTFQARAGHDSGSQLVATFHDTLPAGQTRQPTDYSVSIIWGDGTGVDTTTGSVAADLHSVNGHHTYPSSNTYTILVAVRDNVDGHGDGDPDSSPTQASVRPDAPVNTSTALTVVEQQPANPSCDLNPTDPACIPTNNSALSNPVKLTATVTPAMSINDSRAATVIFYDGATEIGRATASSSGVATMTTTALSLGSHSLTAAYQGNANFNPSTSPAVTEMVAKQDTVMTLSSSPNPSNYGQVVTFTAHVSGVREDASDPYEQSGNEPSPYCCNLQEDPLSADPAPLPFNPTGTVTLLEGAIVLGTGTLDSGGHATITTSSLTAGSHTITIRYEGDANFETDSANLDFTWTGGSWVRADIQTVNKSATSTSLTSSPNPSAVAQSVTFTAHVSYPVGYTPATAPSGAVTFNEGAAQLGQATLQGNGDAVFLYAGLGPGAHAITATYAGDSNFATSTSPVDNQEVGSLAAAVLPAMANGAYGGYTTVTYVQNVGTAPAHVTIQYVDAAGAPVGVGDTNTALAVNGVWTVRQDNGHSFAAGGAGSAIISSDQPVAAFVNEFAPNNASDATSYTAIPIGSGTGGTLYAPAIASAAYGGYTTGIGLVNLGTSATDVTITYRDPSGSIVKAQLLSAVPAGAYRGAYSGDSGQGTDARLAAGFVGTATITSSTGAKLAAIVNETGPGGQLSSYDAVPNGALQLAAPAALNKAYGGFTTGMGIQNTTGTLGNVTVTYYNAAGAATVKTFQIAANGYLGIYQGSAIDGPPESNTGYTATISSSVAIAAIVNEVAPPAGNGAQRSTSYNAVPAGIATVHLPLLENAGSDGWSTGLGVMNTGSTATTVTLTYYDAASGAVIGTPQTATLQPNAFWGPYQPAAGLPSGARATGVVTTASGGQVAVIANESNDTSFMSYNGQ